MNATRIALASTVIDWLGHTFAPATRRAPRRRLTPISALSPHLLNDIGFYPIDAEAALDREKCP